MFMARPSTAQTEITLVNATALETEVSSALCEMRVYRSGEANEGQMWSHQLGVFQFDHSPVTPAYEINRYQMKWEPLSGSQPNTGVASGVWVDLSSTDFYIGWGQASPGTRSGSVTVSIREGVGDVLDTAEWSGTATASPDV